MKKFDELVESVINEKANINKEEDIHKILHDMGLKKFKDYSLGYSGGSVQLIFDDPDALKEFMAQAQFKEPKKAKVLDDNTVNLA